MSSAGAREARARRRGSRPRPASSAVYARFQAACGVCLIDPVTQCRRRSCSDTAYDVVLMLLFHVGLLRACFLVLALPF